MKNHSIINSPNSFKLLSSQQKLYDIDDNEVIMVTVRTRRKKELDAKQLTVSYITRAIYENEYSTSAEDIEKVSTFAKNSGLEVVDSSAARRSVFLKGKVSDFEKTFNIRLKRTSGDNGNFRVLTNEIQIPDHLTSIIEGVFGLDNRPAARPMFQVAKRNGKFISHADAPQAFTPNRLAKIYGFPEGVTGTGQCIALIELGGGFKATDIDQYFTSLAIKAPNVIAVEVNGAKNTPTTADSADGEVMLDIEVAGAIAPGAKILVYFAPNTDQGFLDAITMAIHDTQNNPSIISISWGSAEINWTQQALDNFNEAFKTAAALGVSICVAAGDSGSRDGETDGKVHVDFPASSPYALACGGTKLDVSNNQILSEVVWHESSDSASGGGVSTYFPLPAYQGSANVPLELDTQFKGRGVPDVAADADPDTGYKVLVDGQELVIGGTSAVAPLMAGLIALINEQKGRSSGFIHPQIYATPGICRDITDGDNKTTSTNTGYSAETGWDACTGLGVLSKF